MAKETFAIKSLTASITINIIEERVESKGGSRVQDEFPRWAQRRVNAA